MASENQLPATDKPADLAATSDLIALAPLCTPYESDSLAPAPGPAASSDQPFACPKCRTEQTESDECTQCGIIFAKYVHPRDRLKARQAAAGSRPSRSSGSRRSTGPRAFRSIIGLVCGAAAVSMVAAIALPDSDSNTVGARAEYSPPQALARSGVHTLMDVSQLNADLADMPAMMQEVFSEDFAERAKAAKASPESIDYVLSLVPDAFSASGAQREFANWLSLTLTPVEVSEVTTAFNKPSMQVALAAVRERSLRHQKSEFDAFIKRLERDPLSPRRQMAIENLVDAMSLDLFMAEFVIQGRGAVIKTSALLEPSYDSHTRANSEIIDLRDTIEWTMPALTQHAIHILAWQYQDLDLNDLHRLQKTYSSPAATEYNRELRRGMQEYFRNAQSWLAMRYLNSSFAKLAANQL